MTILLDGVDGTGTSANFSSTGSGKKMFLRADSWGNADVKLGTLTSVPTLEITVNSNQNLCVEGFPKGSVISVDYADVVGLIVEVL